MTAVLNADLVGADSSTRQLATLSHENGAVEVTIRIDNFSHIESAFGCAGIRAAAAMIDMIVGQSGQGMRFPRAHRPDLIAISFGQKSVHEAARRLEALIADLSSSPVEVGGRCFHLAVSCPVFPEANSLASSPVLPAGEPACDDEAWAEAYRRDMAVAVEVLAAMADGRVDLSWQPVLSMQSQGEVLYHEALARLTAATGEARSPGDFFPALERLGLVRAFDRHVMGLALDEMENFPGARLGINISAQSARIDGWWSSMFDRLRAAPDVAGRLVVEITETAALAGEAHAFVARLRRLGCRVALDDFGVGHSSIRNAMALSPDIIKIDAFFLRRVTLSAHGEAMLEHILGLAAHMAPIVIVEGVETEEQSEIAERLQSRYATPLNACWQQGYHVGLPSLWRRWRYEDEPVVVPLHQLGRGTGRFRPWSPNYQPGGRA
ncbi:conserved hypothetical protein [Sphingobium sp. SYK-6]|uniref:EAL domain-containing protein n=1 Tax=Sphingobium sp. (strain NBRC 103272 / SYK-6) TaxID=627192 RepID=UPI0002277094|nr:EAL domain-containing protein [Sphingobium sp. SYK-6]BAK66828.1 conserved hypothetical protein [Sphingobium sp. SYK-6]